MLWNEIKWSHRHQMSSNDIILLFLNLNEVMRWNQVESIDIKWSQMILSFLHLNEVIKWNQVVICILHMLAHEVRGNEMKENFMLSNDTNEV